MSHSRMPALFLGHGSPMNVLEENTWTETWRELGKTCHVQKRLLPFLHTGTRVVRR